MSMTPPPTDHRALILAVDRDPHVRALEQYFLEQAGYRVEFADNGVQCLETARRLLPDVIVCEILVPGLDGLSLCRALKADPATQHIVVLIFSILAAEERALEAGADGYLRKPLDDSTLIQNVERLLAQHHEHEGQANGTH